MLRHAIYRLVASAIFVAVGISACGGGGGDSTAVEPIPVPVDGVGVFTGTFAWSYVPEAGHVGGGQFISDGSGMALGGYRTSTSGAVLDYRFSRSADSTSGNLFLRRYLSSARCSGTGTATLMDNASFNFANWVLTNDGTGQECRGGTSGNYQAAQSEYPATSLVDLAGDYSSSEGPGGSAGGFDVGGNRFTVHIGSDGTFRLTNSAACVSTGTITLVDVGKGIARVSDMLPACASSSTALDGLVAFDGNSLLVVIVQPATYYFYFGTLQKQ